MRRFSAHRLWSRALSAAALATALSLLAACGGSGATSASSRAPSPVAGNPLAPHPLAKRTTVRAAVSGRIASYGAILLAKELGEFEKENIDLGLQVLPAQDSLLLMTQGKLDVVGTSFSVGLLNLTANGADLRTVFPSGGRVKDTRQGIWVNKQIFGANRVFDPDDIKGAKIGTLGGANSLINANLFQRLRNKGGTVTPSDVDMQNLSSSDAVTALKSGTIDVANASSPFHELLLNDPCCQFLPGAFPLRPAAMYGFGPNLLGKQPKTGAAIVRALARTVRTHLQGDYLKDPKVLAAFAKATDTPADQLLRFERSSFDPDFTIPTDDLGIAQKYFRQLGGALQYDKPLRPNQVYDLSFVQAVSPEQ